MRECPPAVAVLATSNIAQRGTLDHVSLLSTPGLPQWSSSGRGDLRRIAALGCNFIRVYNWSPDQARLGGHRAFLSELRSLGLMVAISVRRGAWDRAALEAVVAEAKEFTDVIGVWLIGNEEDLQV